MKVINPFPPISGFFAILAFSWPAGSWGAIVSNTDDSGPGSLRQAILDAEASGGQESIEFRPELSGATITLNSPIIISHPDGVTLRGYSLPDGLTLDGGGAVRIFTISAGSSLGLHRLTLVNGGSSGDGGAIWNAGYLYLADCTVANNRAAGKGGGISNEGTLWTDRCTFSMNTAAAPESGGGAMFNSGTATTRNCTFADNRASAGGAIDQTITGKLDIGLSTITGNTATAGGGGAIRSFGSWELMYSIITGNRSDEGPADDVGNEGGVLKLTGENIIETLVHSGGGTATGTAPITTAPSLAELGDYGGYTATRPLLPWSAVGIDTVPAYSQNLDCDQRCSSHVVDGNGDSLTAFDLGAVESGGLWITHGGDSGFGSLRAAVAAAGVPPGDEILLCLPSVSRVDLETDLVIPTDIYTGAVTLRTQIPGGNLDLSVNSGTLRVRPRCRWSGGGRVLLGATSGNFAATLEFLHSNGMSFSVPVVVRAGATGVKTIRSNSEYGYGCTCTGDIRLEADASFAGRLQIDSNVEIGSHVLSADALSDIYCTGRLFSGEGIGRALITVNGGSVVLDGDSDNVRLTAIVNSGNLRLSKNPVAGVYALGGGLSSSDEPVLTIRSGGRVTLFGPNQLPDSAGILSDGTFDLWGPETIGAFNGTGGSTLATNSTKTLTVGYANANGNYGGNLLRGLSLNKIGAGMQTLSGVTTSTSSTRENLFVGGGTLNVTGKLPYSRWIQVLNGATLAGSGTVPGVTLETGSTIAPGDATIAGHIGTLSVGTAGNWYRWVTWNGGATAVFHLGALADSSDRLVIGEALIKGTGSGFVFDFQNTGVPDTTYTLATFASSGFAATDFSHRNLRRGLTGSFTKSPTALTFTTVLQDPGYDGWKAFWFTSAEVAVCGLDADPDGDAGTNLMEYVFESNPRDSASAPALRLTRTGVLNTLRFPRGTNVIDLELTVEWSASLSEPWNILTFRPAGVAASWTPAPGLSVSESDGEVTVAESVELSSQPRRYYRLRATHSD